ncbi:MAG: hypothetical protein WHF31_16185 [Candidatus Dehalobacter alkaniphilus]
MAKIPLSKGGYSPIPEGEHIFKVVSATYDDDFGKLEVELVTASGQKHTERFNLIGEDGEINEKAQNAFSFFAKTALNNFNLEEIDHEDIVGCYLKCTVEHDIQQSRKDPAKTVTFCKLTDKAPASGFETAEAPPAPASSSKPKAASSPAPAAKGGKVDLDALLG